MQTSLRGIANKAKVDRKHRFQDLYRCLNAAFLHACWKDLNKDAPAEETPAGGDAPDGGAAPEAGAEAPPEGGGSE